MINNLFLVKPQLKMLLIVMKNIIFPMLQVQGI
jgi:hypothetical protein